MKKTFLVIFSVIVLLSLALAPFHHHDDDASHHADCALCRFSEAVFGFITLLAFVFIARPLRAQEFSPVTHDRFQSRFLTYRLQDRAPPFRF